MAAAANAGSHSSNGGSNLLSPPSEKKSLQEQEYLAIRHALPKTRVSHAILHENPSHDRHLNMKLARVKYRRDKYKESAELARKTFLDAQARKQRKWKREDDIRRAGMNFPTIRHEEGKSRPPSMLVVYTSPAYPDKDEAGTVRKGPLLPYMSIRRERTEILLHREHTMMTKLPTVIESEEKKLIRYNTFCGTGLVPVGDDRFQNLANSLTPRVPSPIKPLPAGRQYDDDDSDFSGWSSPLSSAASLQRRVAGVAGRKSAKLALPALARSRCKNHKRDGRPTLHRENAQVNKDTSDLMAKVREQGANKEPDSENASSMQLQFSVKKGVK